MTYAALALSAFIAALGALGVVSPSALLGIVRRFQTPTGVYAAAAIRVVFGVVLLFAAPTSRVPEAVRILAVILIAAGVITPFFGLERFRRLLDWWTALGPGLVRAWAAFAFFFGLVVAYAVAP